MAPQYYRFACLLWFLCLQLVSSSEPKINSTSISDCQAGERCNSSGKFLCKLSGKWIDREFVCDFGRDCGPNDDSDEADCAEYEGRCDFERADQCGWISTRDSWLWLQATPPASADHGDQGAASGHKWTRPLLDHTHQSSARGGHFMLVNVELLDEFKFAQLLGPRVQLKPGHEQCNFRFWLSSQASLAGLEKPLESPYLVVNFEHIHSNDLFQLGLGENGWRRFELALFVRGLERPAHYTSRISFGNFSQPDLSTFRQQAGYLALDDFSFTPGCQLAYYEYEDNSSICPQGQFRCSLAPALTPETYCVPQNRVCDFKPDCGIDPKTSLASDEIGCPKECRFDDRSSSLPYCDLELIDLGENMVLEEGSTRPVSYKNDAFEVKLPGEKNDALEIVSRSEQFHAHRALVPVDNTTLKVESNSVSLSWPSFAQAHANCTLQLDYAFSADALNLVVFVGLVTGGTSRPIHYATIFARPKPDAEAGLRHLFQIGLGEQRRPFRVRLEVEFVSHGKQDNQFAGSFTLFGYKFLNCQYAAGLLDVLKSPIILNTGDGDDDDDDDHDYEPPQFEAARTNLSSITMSCPADQFQCGSPILCLPESLKCDMQIDCQDSALDEFNCANVGAQQYDFEQDVMGQAPAGWLNERADVANAFWTVGGRHKRANRIHYDSGPPVDHTVKSTSGKFLVLSARQPESAPDSIQALIYAPRMKLSTKCKRVVFYFYHWQGALKRKSNSVEFRVFIRRGLEKHSELLYALPPDELSERNWWQRVELQLPRGDDISQRSNRSETIAEQEFRLIFFARLHGTRSQGDLHDDQPRGRDSIFAIDDVAFNAHCELVRSSSARQLEIEGLDLSIFEEAHQTLQDQTRVYFGRPFLMLLVVAAIVVALATFMNHQRRRRHLPHPYDRIGKNATVQDGGLVMSQIQGSL